MRRTTDTMGWMLLAAACNHDVGGAASFGSDDGSSSASSEGVEMRDTSSGGGPTGDESGPSSDDGPQPIFDVGSEPGEPGGCGCGSQLDEAYIWIANSAEGTVSKVNTETMIEEGRYLTREDGGGNPSRTSVSVSGLAVAVANRYGGLTKIWASHASCDPSANGIPGVQTSSGPGDVLPWGEDDCIDWHVPFSYTSQRPVAWSAGTFDREACSYEDEVVWTSGCDGAIDGSNVQVHRVAGDDGTVLDSIEVPGFLCIGFGGYGGAVDGEGNFWISSLDTAQLVRVDAQTLETQIWRSPVSVYGITVDSAGRPWMTCNFGGSGCSAVRFDPLTETFAFADDHVASGQSGIAPDAEGRMWMNYWSFDGVQGGGIVPIDVDTMAVGEPIALPLQAKGVSVDLAGRVWSVSGGPAYRVDPAGGGFEAVDGFFGPYTYSDMTGWALQNVTCNPAG